MNHKKLLIFDLDGTLMYTLTDLRNAINHALKRYGYPPRDLEFVRKAVGNGVQVLNERCLEGGASNPDFDNVFSDFKVYYKEHSQDHTKRYPFILKTLQNLKKKGYLLAVVTNKTDSVAKELIINSFGDVFDMIQGDVDYLKKKPDADMVNYVINTLGVDKKDVCYIGDTNVDHDTAYNAEVDLVLVSYGYRTKEELINYGYHDPIVDSPKDLLKIFE